MKTGFRDDEIAHAQYSDINFKNGTVNVTAKPKGSFPGHPELTWTPKNNSAREKDIVIDEALLKRMAEPERTVRGEIKQLDLPHEERKTEQPFDPRDSAVGEGSWH